MRTPKEIKSEINTLRTMKPTVRKSSIFGDDHHNAIDAQIEVLETKKSTDAIYDRWEAMEDDDINLDDGRAENVLEAALDARRWMDKEKGTEAPSENWKSLVKK